ncbi:MAG: tRNA 4-thiouridine(8) synthase ThiI [Candidatus Omnitrophica bacterium]|nr:tRNA 4-thiouridine(8) synthase ThiI [Candidatus Omnitrophota bacterium]MCM8802798.1 tRNA 4-thiouridine(8) synthase ThiI [Candidatus Omnitrophota bacterium]
MKKIALGLISGGLDSILALQLIREQDFEIIGIFIKTPFIPKFGEQTIKNLKKISEDMNFELRIIEADDDYIEIIRNPKYGYGKNLNPCIDCHIYMLKKAKKIMEKENIKFIFTGEVLEQRGKSQNLNALKIIEQESSLKGKLLRPLTALNLPPTEVEKKGIVKRELLLGIKGRERKLQLYLAELKNLKYFGTPSGGCLLTDKIFCKKLKDLFENSEKINLKDCYILQVGRHFRISTKTKLIITRDEQEAKKIVNFCNEDDILIFSEESPEIVGVIKGKIDNLAFEIYGSYLKKSQICSLKNLKGEIIEKVVVEKTDKLNYQKFLL